MPHLISAVTALVFAAIIVGAMLLFKRFGVGLSKVIKPCAAVLFTVSFLRYLYLEPAI